MPDWIAPARDNGGCDPVRTDNARRNRRPGFDNFTIIERRDGVDIAHTGSSLDIERPHRLALTFALPHFSADCTRMSIDIAAPTSGGRDWELTFTRSHVHADYANRTTEGWTRILDGLTTTLG